MATSLNKIYIYDSANPKWGVLSNNYLKKLIVGDKTYKSVTHYVYSNLVGIDTPTGEMILNETDTPQISKFVNENYRSIIEENNSEILRRALDNALRSLIQKQDFRNALKNLRGKIILYDSANEILGIGGGGGGADKKGRNMYGNMLMTYRDLLRTEREDFRELYDLYVVISSMKELLISGQNNLSEFIDSTPQEVARKIKLNPPVDYKTFAELLEQQSLRDLEILKVAREYPKELASILRKRFYGEYNRAIIESQKMSLLNICLSAIISQQYKNVKNSNLAISQQLSKLSPPRIQELQDRLYHLYIRGGSFPPETKSRLDKLFSPLLISESVEDYKEPLGSEIPMEMDEKMETILIPDSSSNLLSPRYIHEDMIYIDTFPYPSLSHYLLFTLMVSIPSEKGLFNTARSAMLKDPQGSNKDVDNYKSIFEFTEDYLRMIENIAKSRKLEFLKIALNTKFTRLESDTVNILLRSGNKKLIYNDPYDEYISNHTEQILMDIRQQLSELPPPPLPRKVKVRKETAMYPRRPMNEYLDNNKFLIEWVDKRLEDICRAMSLVHSYTENARGKTVFVDKNFSNFVINRLYNVCLSTRIEEDIVADMPLDFEDKMRKYLRSEVMFGREAVENTWIYIDSLIYNMKKYAMQKYQEVNESTIKKSLKDIMEKVENEGGSLQDCKGPYTDPDTNNVKFKNCIFRSLMTVSANIKNFVERNYGVQGLFLDEELLRTSLYIILPGGLDRSYKPLKLGEVDESILGYLPSFDPRGVMEHFNGIVDMISRKYSINRELQVRILFFVNEKPV